MIRELCFNLSQEYEKYNYLIKYTHMKSLLKNLGLILVIIGAVILVACFLYRQC